MCLMWLFMITITVRQTKSQEQKAHSKKETRERDWKVFTLAGDWLLRGQIWSRKIYIYFLICIFWRAYTYITTHILRDSPEKSGDARQKAKIVIDLSWRCLDDAVSHNFVDHPTCWLPFIILHNKHQKINTSNNNRYHNIFVLTPRHRRRERPRMYHSNVHISTHTKLRQERIQNAQVLCIIEKRR